MLNKIWYWQDKETQLALIQTLKSNNIVVATSDTVIGLLGQCSWQAYQQINHIKRREHKPYIILIENIFRLKQLSAMRIEGKIELLLEHCWPGPLTIIVPAKEDVPVFLKSATNSLALRVPDHQGLLDILRLFPGLLSTSANIAGQAIPSTIEQLDPVIAASVSMIVTDRNYQATTVPSTIIDATGPALKIVREGVFSRDYLQDLLGMTLG